MQLYTLITGASSGIGKELAGHFAKHGHSLILTGRNLDRLNQVAVDLRTTYSVSVEVVVADLAESNGPKKLFDTITKKGWQVTNLVNNAGLGISGQFADQDWRTNHQLIQVNIIAAVELIHYFLPQMKHRKTGSILNVVSTSAFQPGPFMANYFASKSYLLSFSEAIGYELSASGIWVTALCPGPVQTQFFETAKATKTKLAKSPMILSAEKVAEIAYNGWFKKKKVIIPGFLNWVLAKSAPFTPRPLVLYIASRLNQE